MPTTKISKAEAAYLWIRERITSGEFQPGYRLTLPTIADALEISVVPVREAIRRLEAEGLATFERNVGAKVAMIDLQSYKDAMETLAFLEGVATGLATPFLTEDDLQQAEGYNQEMEKMLEELNPIEFTQKNQEFHQVLFDKCPNQHMIELVQAEWVRLRNLRESTFSFVPERAAESVKEHRAILQAIRNKQTTSQIEKAARDHVLATLNQYLQQQENQNTHV